MSQNCIHYFTEGHTAKGFVSFYDSNFAPLSTVIPLHNTPGVWSSGVMAAIAAQQMEQGDTPQFIHNCLDNSLQGLILPQRGAGIFAHPPQDDSPQQSLKEAYGHFARGLAIHDDWERIYIANLNKDVLNDLARKTAEQLLEGRQLDKQGQSFHRYLGAATADGPVDYVPNLTAAMTRRIFIKGRPGTGKSTLLKKIASHANACGFDAEVYHCGFDPDSLDLVILRELSVCIFDSTAPHEYFPHRAGDEILDVYALAVAPGTDEAYAPQLAQIVADYQAAIGDAIACLKTARGCYDTLQTALLAQFDFTKARQQQQEILSKIRKLPLVDTPFN